MAKTRSRSPRGTRKGAGSSRGKKVIQLKPVYVEIGRTLRRLRSAPASREVKAAIARLTQCAKAIDRICGPTMAIPIQKLPRGMAL